MSHELKLSYHQNFDFEGSKIFLPAILSAPKLSSVYKLSYLTEMIKHVLMSYKDSKLIHYYLFGQLSYGIDIGLISYKFETHKEIVTYLTQYGGSASFIHIVKSLYTQSIASITMDQKILSDLRIKCLNEFILFA